ncbi:hypothetical protein QYM36_005651, partial [Artemia franciscana]
MIQLFTLLTSFGRFYCKAFGFLCGQMEYLLVNGGLNITSSGKFFSCGKIPSTRISYEGCNGRISTERFYQFLGARSASYGMCQVCPAHSASYGMCQICPARSASYGMCQ